MEQQGESSLFCSRENECNGARVWKVVSHEKGTDERYEDLLRKQTISFRRIKIEAGFWQMVALKGFINACAQHRSSEANFVGGAGRYACSLAAEKAKKEDSLPAGKTDVFRFGRAINNYNYEMNADLSPMSSVGGKEPEVNCHLKSDVNVPVIIDGTIVTMDNTSYVTVEGGRYAGDFSSYLRDRDKTEFHSQDQLYTLSQRFDGQGNHPSCEGEEKPASDEDQASLRLQKSDNCEPADVQDGKHYKSLKVCVYLMSKVALDMELEDGVDCTAQDMIQSILQEEELGLPRSAGSVFTLWMCSGLVELQLKPHHKPYEIRQRWRDIIERFSNASDSCKGRDEPALSFQRNVYFSKKEEELIKDHKILDLLYEEARYNIIEGRYPCEPNHYISLGAIQARIELGPYSPHIHTIRFFRENQARFLPAHIRRTAWSWLRISGKNSPEVRLLEQYKRIPSSTAVKKLIQKYLEFCWTLPYYGGAFFQGQIEQPVRGLTSLITHQDMPVLIIINNQGVYIVDQIQCTLLLGLKYQDMSWDYAKPSQEDNPDCLPCLFVQFVVLENGARVSKILQVFSRQAVMMDALISTFVDDMKRKSNATELEGTAKSTCGDTSTDGGVGEEAQMALNNRRDLASSCLCNKLSKLTLATFDDDGHCIGKSGSWSFTY